MKKKILFITPYPFDSAPSQRFRFEHFFDLLKKEKFQFTQQPFFSEEGFAILYKKGFLLQKLWHTIAGFFKRFLLLFSVAKYDFVFIHREATPIGPPIIEWLIAKVFRKKIIYDFDDAIWLSNTSAANTFVSKIKFHSKVKNICSWSYKITVGNDFLADFAKQYNTNVVFFPTVVNTAIHHEKFKKTNTKTTVGWTGSHSTMQYLSMVFPVLEKLQKNFDFDVLIISDKKPEQIVKNLIFVPWKKETEAEDLGRIDIGIMPLVEDAWAKGKCGFKAIQYMALGIPAVVSPVGVNTQIVDDGINGFWCADEKDWEEKLSLLLANPTLINSFKKAATEKIENNYSVHSQQKKFIALFE